MPDSSTPSAAPAVATGLFRRSWKRPWFRWTFPLLLSIALGSILGVGFAAAIRMPKVDALSEFRPARITEVAASDGSVYATFSRERRVVLEEGDLPELLQNAVIAAEDSNFFAHGGVDVAGIARALLRNASAGRRAQGASTITMQLARELFLSRDKNWSRKIEEAFLSVELEKNLSKQQILTLYCNLIYLGHGNYGFEAATQYLFDKSVHELTLPEAATLAGIPQRPSSYSPYRAPERVTQRRNYVLGRMLDDGFIDQSAYDDAINTALRVVPRESKVELGAFFSEEVRRALEQELGTAALLEQGLTVDTTLDPVIQLDAEVALRENLMKLDRRRGWRGAIDQLPDGEDPTEAELPQWTGLDPHDGEWAHGVVVESGRTATVRIGDSLYTLDADAFDWTGKAKASALLDRGDIAWFSFTVDDEGNRTISLEQEPEMEGAMLVVESSTGAVRAMVGGWSFARSKFNRATQAKRQVGSAFKPFVYGPAIEAGFSGADTLFDGPVVFGTERGGSPYSPRNYYRDYYGIITLRRALELSANVTAVKLMDLVGVDQTIDFARRAGIASNLPPYPSLALGAAELTPLELTAAYAALANRGIYMEPYLVERISRPDGSVVRSYTPRARKTTEPEVAYVLTSLLEGVVDRGTAKQVKSLGIDLAGKTGTTDSYTDAWFVGYTPRYTILNWVGFDKKRSLGRGMTGATAALPAWKSVVAAGLEHGWLTPGEKFAAPAGIELAAVEYYSGQIATPLADSVITEAFLPGTAPVLKYDDKTRQITSLPWFQQAAFYLPKEAERMPDQIRDWGLVERAWSKQ